MTNKNQAQNGVACAASPARVARPVARLRRRPDGFGALWPNLEALFEPFWGSDDAPAADFRPAIELSETDEAYQIRAELPGVARENIELKLEELEGWVRHGKFKKLRDAFAHLPARQFDDIQ